MDEWLTVQFIGGPLDGEGRVHPAMNYRLTVKGNPEGVYIWNGGALAYIWITRDDDSNAERTGY